ncbi:MAG: Abi family protein [Bacteroidaceae bacterium]|nr:Abi family protein [Bacteroidaceae bacterium]
MARTQYEKQAKSFDEQISILRRNGVVINDEIKAKEYLSDIGYYRLGFYAFPFEVTYPIVNQKRLHDVRPGTTIEEIVALYYYDFDLRSILNKYLSRIEVSIRTTITYQISLKYSADPYWFVNPSVMKASFIADFDKEVYSHVRNKPTIVRHRKKYIDKYAPAWKTMEFMTFGNLEVLYDNLIFDVDKKLVSNQYGEPAVSAFKSYLSAVRELRNACAHGNVIYELRLTSGIVSGKACPTMSPGTNQNLVGTLQVVDYLLRKISVNRANDLQNELKAATLRLYKKVPSIKSMVENNTGIIVQSENDNIFRMYLRNIVKKVFR